MVNLDQDYWEFERYYQSGFEKDLNRFFESYCIVSQNDTVFLGFNKDNLIHMDTIIINLHINEIVFPNVKDLAMFSMAVWTVVVSDIIVYSFFHEYSELWENKTHYPKFTGWNYYAVEPSFIWKMVKDAHPECNLYEAISIMTRGIGERIIDEIANDIISILNLNVKEKEIIVNFARSWLYNDSFTKGDTYNLECFLC